MEQEQENLDGQDDIIISEEQDVQDDAQDVLESDEEIKSSSDEKEPEAKPDDSDEKAGKEEPSKEEKKDEIDPVQKRINKIVYEKKVAEESAEAERAKREEVEAKLAELTKEIIPEIPDIPDILDPDFEAKLKERDALIVRHAQDRANKEALAKIQVDKAADEQRQDAEKVQSMIKNFDTRTEELKLNKDTLVESQNTVGKFLTGKRDLCRYLLSEENGPLNVLYLSQNTEELEKISKMPETEAAVYIATKVAPKAEGLKPKTTKAPDPHYIPSGKGKIEDEDPNLEGCKFE